MQRWSQSILPVPSGLFWGWDSLGGEENGLATGGAEAVLQFQVAEQEGTECRQVSVLALDPLPIFTFRGHCMEAWPRMRQSLHVSLFLHLKGTAVPWASP